MIKQGRVTLNGIPVKTVKHSLNPTDTLDVLPKKKFGKDQLDIVYEDRYCVVVNKPRGLLSVADEAGKKKNLHSILKRRAKKERVIPIHRLDRDTSGLILFAYGDRAKERLKEAMFERKIEREYLAILEGQLKEEKGVWKSRLIEDKDLYVRPHKDGKEAITYFAVTKRTKRHTHVRLTLKTGRKNQIRAQALEHGHPIVGDRKYGSTENPFARLALHAHSLSFNHPINGRRLTFKAPFEIK